MTISLFIQDSKLACSKNHFGHILFWYSTGLTSWTFDLALTDLYYPAPGRVLFSGDFFLCFFVSLSATLGLQEKGWTDLHGIFREGVE